MQYDKIKTWYELFDPQLIEITKYLTRDEWKNKTGSYAVQGYGAFFINYISGSYSGAVGLPLEKLYHVLKDKKIL